MKSNEQETKKVPAPRLRFKQFEGSGEWEEKKLGEVADVYQPVTITSTELKPEGFSVYGANGKIGFYDKYNHETWQTLITCRGSTSGVVSKSEDFSWITGNAMVANVDSNREVDKDYFYYLVGNQNFSSIVSGSGQPQITRKPLADWLLHFPPLPEQTHIAACLSSLDAVISAHQSKLDALRQHKRALMQQLFPQEGEKVPRLRFPEFEGSGEWEEKKLGDIAMMSSGGTPSSTVSEYYGGSIPWVSISDMTKSGKYLDRTEKSLTRLGLENSAAKIFPENTILFAMYASIGKCNIASLPVSTSQAILGIIPLNDNSTDYIYYFLSDNEKKYADMGQHGTQKNLNAGMVKALPIPLPPTLPEQTRIAACLSSLDDLISAQADKVAGLREFKRGLMQGLFPSTTNHEATE